MIMRIFKTPNSKDFGIWSFENTHYHFSRIWVWFTKYYEHTTFVFKKDVFDQNISFSNDQLLFDGFWYLCGMFVLWWSPYLAPRLVTCTPKKIELLCARTLFKKLLLTCTFYLGKSDNCGSAAVAFGA